MLSAKLIKALEKKGFYLEFPNYDSNEEIIIEILNENNPRINLSLPIFLNEELDYKRIKSLIGNSRLKELNKIIDIAWGITPTSIDITAYTIGWDGDKKAIEKIKKVAPK